MPKITTNDHAAAQRWDIDLDQIASELYHSCLAVGVSLDGVETAKQAIEAIESQPVQIVGDEGTSLLDQVPNGLGAYDPTWREVLKLLGSTALYR